MAKNIDVLHPDSKGRITLGALAKGISSYHVTVNKDSSILLEPYTEIPMREKWIFENPDVLAKIKRGIEDSAKGRCSYLGDDFSK